MNGIPSWARPGQRVACVSDLHHATRICDQGFRDIPAVGKRYTIARAKWYPQYQCACLFLVGFNADHGFDSRAFRPIEDGETEATLFRKKHGRVPDAVDG